MSPERFEALVAAFGAEPARWPAAEREAAEACQRQNPEVLSVERALDAALDAWRLEPASAALRERILAAAPRERARWSWRQVWLPGAGLAAACAAGAMVGVTLVGPSVAGAFPAARGEAPGILSDGVSVFGSSLDQGATR